MKKYDWNEKKWIDEDVDEELLSGDSIEQAQKFKEQEEKEQQDNAHKENNYAYDSNAGKDIKYMKEELNLTDDEIENTSKDNFQKMKEWNEYKKNYQNENATEEQRNEAQNYHNKITKKDENSEKKIEQSQENGFSKEQAESAPNDVLVKDDKDADITLTDSSPKNIEEVKYGNLDAKITPDSDFNLSPEMEKWLLANGWSKNGEKKDSNAGKKLDLYNDSDEIINKLVDMGFDDKTAHKILSTIRLSTSGTHYDSDEINRVADFYKNYKKEKKDSNAGKEMGEYGVNEIKILNYTTPKELDKLYGEKSLYIIDKINILLNGEKWILNNFVVKSNSENGINNELLENSIEIFIANGGFEDSTNFHKE